MVDASIAPLSLLEPVASITMVLPTLAILTLTAIPSRESASTFVPPTHNAQTLVLLTATLTVVVVWNVTETPTVPSPNGDCPNLPTLTALRITFALFPLRRTTASMMTIVQFRADVLALLLKTNVLSASSIPTAVVAPLLVMLVPKNVWTVLMMPTALMLPTIMVTPQPAQPTNSASQDLAL